MGGQPEVGTETRRWLSAVQIDAMVARAFGPEARVELAQPLSGGTYNAVYRLELDDGQSLVLRAAPLPEQQGPSDAQAMRNEYAASPFMAALGPVVPRMIAADFTHQIVPRDYVFQNVLPGLPASEVLPQFPEEKWPHYYRQLGRLTALIHEVRGERFGRVAGPLHDTWSQEVEHRLQNASSAYAQGGLDNAHVERVLALVARHRDSLDQLRSPSLLHGDLWTINTLIDPATDEPTITGVLDFDGACWGDPLADAPVHSALQRAGTVADEFWETYPRPPRDEGTEVRQLFAWALNVVGIRLDIHRRGLDLSNIPPTHWDVSGTLLQLNN